ncbi:M57 family metalloprotease [Myxococcus landrumensis]|uniref:Protease B n=1 Tax=Myxococcus landrumensis TaxID=2813577 RepID=A0ABX7NNU5_9BACT|nr:M57 family metalloprotease [Myxococcus landrumus]QSQ17888.1 protease B [Myxococcus landrumus]
MFKQTAVLAVTGVALLVGCGGMDPQMENEEIISNLIEAGYPANDIRVIDEAVFVSGDTLVTLQASREMLQTPAGSAEHYRSNNLVGPQVTKICIIPSSAFNSSPMLSQGLNLAIENYNQLGLRFSFARDWTPDCSATIEANISTAKPDNWAGFPEGGLPFGSINMVPAMNDQTLDINEHIITHELGHTIGLRHTDYFDRSISCVPPYTGVEGPETVGVNHIEGTPTGAVWDGSVMNACPHAGNTGEFTGEDINALDLLYGKPCSSINLAESRGQTGKQIRCICAPGVSGSVWGTNNYTDDSNICSAAVHAGVRTPLGGRVVVEVQPAQTIFIGTTRNGVTSNSYGAWGGSFRFIGPQVPQPPPLCSSFNVMGYRGQNGVSIRCTCPTVTLGASVWGTDLYTDDSNVCAAAVHAGAIPATGGQVSVTIQPGQSSYAGTSRNGVTTSSYGAWSGSISLSP